MADQSTKIQELKTRLSVFMDRVDRLDPETTSVEDIDQLIAMLDELEKMYE
ncbi:SE1561 family protein [Bacillaceae bacterium S4-13-58]